MAESAHSALTTTNLHVPGYMQDSDPGAIGAGKYWVDTSGGPGAWEINVRNEADDGWENISTGGGGGGTTYDYVLIEDQRASGTASGSLASGAWRTRPLNTEVVDTGNHASVASNQITLDAGTYRINAWGLVYAVARNVMRLQNITDAVTLLNGSSSYSNTDASAPALLTGRFTLGATKTLELQHRVETTSGTFGFGVAAGTLFTVDHEVFTSVELWKE